MKILIFGGTTEGRLLAQALSQRGLPATVSVATPLGAQELSGLPGITPLVGRKTAQEMAELLKSFDRCVDATHPYAVEASRNIRTGLARQRKYPAAPSPGREFPRDRATGWKAQRKLPGG